MYDTPKRALELLEASGFATSAAEAALAAFERGGIKLADTARGEFVCRWINVAERVVPPTADTIIRTVTRTQSDHSVSRTHWLEGIEPPPFPASSGD